MIFLIFFIWINFKTNLPGNDVFGSSLYCCFRSITIATVCQALKLKFMNWSYLSESVLFFTTSFRGLALNSRYPQMGIHVNLPWTTIQTLKSNFNSYTLVWQSPVTIVMVFVGDETGSDVPWWPSIVGQSTRPARKVVLLVIARLLKVSYIEMLSFTVTF